MSASSLLRPKFEYSPFTDKWRPVKQGASSLSRREHEVVCLMALAHSTDQIAQILNVKPSTIRRHRQRAFEKLEIFNPVTLTHFVLSRGMIKNLYSAEPNG